MSIWNLSAANAFNYIVLRVDPGLTSCEDLATALAFAHHFVAPHPPHTLPPYTSASSIGYASKKLSKMVGNLASYPVYSIDIVNYFE